MDKELIKKYKQEFEHWLAGGELLFMPEDKQTWFNTLISEIDWSIKGIYVINDNYVQLRIALAEGKTIQVYKCIKESVSNPSLDIYGWKDLKKFKPTIDCTVANYRIKPEEPKFKVGDWVVEIHSTTKAQVLELFGNQIRVKFCYPDAIITTDSSDFIPWIPKEGDWCWFWDSGNFPELRQFKRLLISNKYQSSQTLTYDYCEPFLGKLPTTLKGV